MTDVNVRGTMIAIGQAPAGGSDPVAHRTGSPYAAYTDHVHNVQTTQNDLIVVLCGWSTSGTCSVADNASGGSNTYTPLTLVNGSNIDNCVQIFYAVAKATETVGTVTMTLGDGGNDPGLSVHVYYNTPSSNPLEAEATGWANTSTPATSMTSGNMVTSLTNGVIVAIAGNESADPTFVPVANFTQRTYETSHWHMTEDRIISTGATYTAGVTMGSNDCSCLAAAMFKGN